MTPIEFLNQYGLPSNARGVTEGQLEAARFRLPETLIEFWRVHGVGSYSDGNYWLCTPDLFDPVLDILLENIPELRGELAAFGYMSTGQVDLWHRAERHFTLLLPFSAFVDETSRSETAQVPYDLADLYQAAGVSMPDDAEAQFLAGRSGREDIWSILFEAASTDGPLNDIGDDGRPLPASLKRRYGPLEAGEIYLRDPSKIMNIADSYAKLPLQAAFERLSDQVTVTRMIEVGTLQEAITESYKSGQPK